MLEPKQLRLKWLEPTWKRMLRRTFCTSSAEKERGFNFFVIHRNLHRMVFILYNLRDTATD